MALDARYIPFGVLQEYFPDKDTGTPLAAGIVRFFSDINRTQPKEVFQISGTPPNYSYTSLGAVLELSAVGTFQNDDGDDIIPYLFPYDVDGNIELYYITCVSSGAIPQFTREGWPNVFSNKTDGENALNYIPNGQFLIHNDIPATSTTIAGQITQAITILTQGGWSFERPNSTSAIDIVTFERSASPATSPTSNPRYSVRIATTTPNAGDTFKDLRVKFRDVNKFSSDDQEYTFSFTAVTNNGGSTNAIFKLVKNYGNGGSTETIVTIDTVTIEAVEGIFNIPFIFGLNEGKTIGLLDDDYLQLSLSFPTNTVFDISLTDAILTPGNVIVTGFPQTTDAEFLYRSIAGWMPTPQYNGHDLYLPLCLTPSGLTFDHSGIGLIQAAYTSNLPISYLACDGAMYETETTSSDGIPYERLQSYLWSDTLNIPLAGTGDAYMTAYISYISPANQLRISTNQPDTPGTVTNASDGAIATGFTIATTHEEATYGVNGYINGEASDISGPNLILVISTLVGATTAPTANTSGFTITDVRNLATSYHVFEIQTVGASGLEGLYFKFSTVLANYYMWFTVDGVGIDPAPGGTGIKVDLLSSYGANEVAAHVRESISGFQITTVITVAASAITAGAYFNISTAATNFYCWYKKSGVGTDPAPTGKVGIEVDILNADTDEEVASKTQIAINSKYFAVPDLRGVILRGYDPSAVWDLDGLSRWSPLSSLYGPHLGTFELDAFLSHNHSLNIENNAGNVQPNGDSLLANLTNTGGQFWRDMGVADLAVGNQSIGYSGGTESRPVNAYVNFIIKY